MRIWKWLGGLVLVLGLSVAGLGVWLHVAPPELIRVGAQYTAKIVCSNVFLAGRDPQQVLADDVQAPGHPLLRIMQVDVDRDTGTVRAGLLGQFGNGFAVHREGVGCTGLPQGDLASLVPVNAHRPISKGSSDAHWPSGNRTAQTANPQLDAVLDDPALAGPGMRALVVVKDGRIIAERYADGFTPETPLLGWSMAKTVTAALVGLRVGEGKLSLDQKVGTFPDWSQDARSEITLGDLMGMASDLDWNEGYGSVSDVTRMLYLEPDMAAFVASKRLDTASPEGIGDHFVYSSGATVLISRILQAAAENTDDAAAYASTALFDRLGMESATLELDEAGTPVGSSYIYASARDWARFGLFLLQKGRWNGQAVLPEGYVDWMIEPHPASGERYGRGQVWLEPQNNSAPGPDAGLPEGSFFMNGHDGQSVSIIPSENLVVVRLGLTPSDLGYKVETLVDAVISATAD